MTILSFCLEKSPILSRWLDLCVMSPFANLFKLSLAQLLIRLLKSFSFLETELKIIILELSAPFFKNFLQDEIFWINLGI